MAFLLNMRTRAPHVGSHRLWPRSIALLVLMCAVPAAAAEPSYAGVNGQVLVILAQAEPGPFDAELARFPALRKAPFANYKSMTLLSRHNISLDDRQPTTVQLPKGRSLQLTLLGRAKDGRRRIQVSISRPGKRDYLPLLTVLASDEPFFVAGQHYQGGTLVIGVRITR